MERFRWPEFFLEPAGAADSQCSTGQWNCSSCGWDGIGQCCSLCGAAWKSAAFSVMRNSANVAAGIPFCTWIAGSPKLWQCAGYYVLLFWS